MQAQYVGGGRYTYGAYNADDFFFTASLFNTEAMRAADREVILERLSNFGLIGYAHFLINKARWVTSDGTFYWGSLRMVTLLELPSESSPFEI